MSSDETIPQRGIPCLYLTVTEETAGMLAKAYHQVQKEITKGPEQSGGVVAMHLLPSWEVRADGVDLSPPKTAP